jgi:2-polyprenyl-3-methyl-5-hydroxy-6-metoxy-1,4-benzoquinol methylase
MPNLGRRSYQKELLDGDDIPFEDIARNMKELNFINTYLGGHTITLYGMKKLIDARQSRDRALIICEIGCGGGDNLNVISKWGKRNNIKLRTIGIDINPDCIGYASAMFKDPLAAWLSADYRTVRFEEKPDIIFNSLFCHHFDDEQMIEVLKWMKNQSRIGFFINDLHRHTLAFYSIKWLTLLFSKSYLVKNDAPLSVQRGFKKNELKEFLDKAGIQDYTIDWKWAFRWLITSANIRQD